MLIFIYMKKLTRLYIECASPVQKPNPDYSAFFDFTSYPFTSPAYIYKKAGHALALATIVLWKHPFFAFQLFEWERSQNITKLLHRYSLEGFEILYKEFY